MAKRGILTPQQARLLFTIWTLDRLEKKSHEITAPALSLLLGMPPSSVRRHIASLGADYVESANHPQTGARGRPTVFYRLAQGRMVTFTESALTLINLPNCEQERIGLVRVTTFASFMLPLIRYSMTRFNDQMEYLIRTKYLRGEPGPKDPVFVAKLFRTDRDMPYLTKIAPFQT